MAHDCLVYCALALIAWGLWGFFPKLAVSRIDPKSALVFDAIGGLIVGIVVLCALKFKVNTDRTGAFYGVLTGICGLSGALFFLYAMSRGKASSVAVVTTLYPLITIPLAYFILGEKITAVNSVGMALGIVAIVLMSM